MVPGRRTTEISLDDNTRGSTINAALLYFKLGLCGTSAFREFPFVTLLLLSPGKYVSLNRYLLILYCFVVNHF